MAFGPITSRFSVEWDFIEFHLFIFSHKFVFSENIYFFFIFQPSFLQFRLDRFETSLNLFKEDEIKIKENKILTDSLENKENTPNFSENHEVTQPESDQNENLKLEVEKPVKKSSGPRALKRRHGRKNFNKSSIQRRSSFNGHW